MKSCSSGALRINHTSVPLLPFFLSRIFVPIELIFFRISSWATTAFTISSSVNPDSEIYRVRKERKYLLTFAAILDRYPELNNSLAFSFHEAHSKVLHVLLDL